MILYRDKGSPRTPDHDPLDLNQHGGKSKQVFSS